MSIFFFLIRGFVHQNNVESVATVPRCVCVGRGGGERGGGGTLRISRDGDDGIGAKIKTPKNP